MLTSVKPFLGRALLEVLIYSYWPSLSSSRTHGSQPILDIFIRLLKLINVLIQKIYFQLFYSLAA